jgi:hypothetical protein
LSADDEKPPLDAALRHLAEQQRRSLTGHPTPQELAAYHAGELPPEAEARVLDHLAICRECSDLLLDISGFADLKPPAGVPELTDAQVEQDWQALRAKMRVGEGRKERTAEVVPIRPMGPAARPARWTSLLLPVAASLLAVIGFSFGLYQSVQVSRLSRPRVVPVISSADVERGETIPRVSSQNGGVIYLEPGPEKEYPRYEAELIGGEEVLARFPIGPIDGSASIMVPPLEPGSYHIRLYGIEGGRAELSSDFSFEANDP